jgi:nicotinamidase-related amidase
MLAACRVAGMTIVHTLEAHLPDLSDLHPSKYRRGNPPKGSRIGDSTVETLRCPSNGVCLGPSRLLVRGSPGNDLIPELKAIEVRNYQEQRGNLAWCLICKAFHFWWMHIYRWHASWCAAQIYHEWKSDRCVGRLNEMRCPMICPQGEKIVYKPGKGAFYSTDLDEFLTAKGITHLIFAGVTTEVRCHPAHSCSDMLLS